MTSKDFILNTFRAKGKADAQALQKQAKNLTGTEIIANEGCIPEWEPNKDYSSWLVAHQLSMTNKYGFYWFLMLLQQFHQKKTMKIGHCAIPQMPSLQRNG